MLFGIDTLLLSVSGSSIISIIIIIIIIIIIMICKLFCAKNSALDKLGKHDRAIEYRNKCIELDPESVCLHIR
jgi:hypothetical protein